MDKRGFKKGVIFYLSMALVSLISFGTAMSAAAYIIIERHNQNIKIDLDYSSFFGGGDGTVTAPYLVKNSAQLRNLSYLVNSGLLNENHHIKLQGTTDANGKETITWGANDPPLTPIGTDQNPFNCQLEGNVPDVAKPGYVTVISGLKVEGNNLADVGMFGYIGNKGYVNNFVLDKPVVISKGNTFDRINVDNNPMRTLKNGTKTVFSEASLKDKIVFTPTGYIERNQYSTSFTIKYPSKEDLTYDYDLKNKIQLSADVKVEVSNSSFFTVTNDASTNTTTFTCNKVAQIPTMPNSKKPMEGDYATISIVATAVCPTPEGNRLAKLTLERYRVYYNYSNAAIVSDPENFKTFTKTIYPEVSYVEQNDEGGDYIVRYDETRALYVGVLAGRLDGKAEYIGVNLPTLDIQRPFISNSILIGKAIDDDNKRTLTKDQMINLKVVQAPLATIKSPKHLHDFKKANSNLNFDNSDYNSGNRHVANIYKEMIPFDPSNNGSKNKFDSTSANGYSSQGGFEYNTQNIVKIYDRHFTDKGETEPYTGQENITLNPMNVYLTDTGDEYFISSENAPQGQKAGPVNAISITSPKVDHFELPKISTTTGSLRGFDKGYFGNAIQLWVSAKHDRGKTRTLGNGALDFYLKFTMYYLYFDDAAKDGVNGYNQFDVDVAHKCLGQRRVNKESPKVFFSKPYHLRGSNTADTQTLLDDVPYEDQAPKGQVKSPTVYPFSYVEKDPTTNTNPLIFNEISDTYANRNNGRNHKVLTKTITIAANHLFIRDPKENMQIPKGFFPCFYLGFKPRTTSDKYRLDILGMDVFLSNKRGNIDSSTGFIDFVGADLKLPFNGTTWKSTGAKIYAKTICDEERSPKSSAPIDLTRFCRVHDALVSNGEYLVKHYYIQIEKTDKGITGTYNIVGNGYTDDEYYKMENTEGFKKATIDGENDGFIPAI